MITLQTVDRNKWISVRAAAVELSVKEATIRSYLSIGKLGGAKYETLTLVSKADVMKYKLKQEQRNVQTR